MFIADAAASLEVYHAIRPPCSLNPLYIISTLSLPGSNHKHDKVITMHNWDDRMTILRESGGFQKGHCQGYATTAHLPFADLPIQ